MTNNVTSLTSRELIALATEEAKAEMRRRMANTRKLAHINSAKVRAYNAMAEFLGLETITFVRKDGTEMALTKSNPAKSSKKTSSSGAKKTSKKSSAKTPSLEERMATVESDIASLKASQDEILSILRSMKK